MISDRYRVSTWRITPLWGVADSANAESARINVLRSSGNPAAGGTAFSAAVRSLGITLVLLGMSTVCAVADQPRCDSWVDLYRGEPLPYADLLDDVKDADIIYVGETHSIKRHHVLQQQILRDVAKTGQPLVLGLEQMEKFQQPILDKFNAGEVDFDELARETDWAKRWGNFLDYREILQTARDHGVPVLALNARRETIRAVARQGGVAKLSAEQRQELPAELNFDEPPYERLLNLQLMVHMTMSEERLQPVREAQMARDETMADALCSYLKSPDGKGKRAIVLCGNGHISYALGTVSRVRRRLPDAKDRIIVLADSGDLELTPEEKAFAREIEITHEQLREVGHPIGDYLHLRSLAASEDDD
jgi:uncharacterized iron-regulated protein